MNGNMGSFNPVDPKVVLQLKKKRSKVSTQFNDTQVLNSWPPGHPQNLAGD